MRDTSPSFNLTTTRTRAVQPVCNAHAHALQRLLKTWPVWLIFCAQSAWAAPFAYVPVENNNNVQVIDLATNTQVGAPIALSNRPSGIAFNPSGTRVYVANLIGGGVSVIDTSTNTVITTIIISGNPQGMVVSPDGTRLYVAQAFGTQIKVIDTATNAVINTFTGFNAPLGLAISPDGSRLYVANSGVGQALVVDALTGAILSTVGVGLFPYGIALNAAGTRLSVANYSSSSVSVIDTTTTPPAVIATISGINGPLTLAFNPSGTRLYVSFTRGIKVIDTSTNTVVATAGASNQLYGVTFNPVNGLVYSVSNVSPGLVKRFDPATNAFLQGDFTVGGSPAVFGNFIQPVPPAPTALSSQTLTFAPAPDLVVGGNAPTSAVASSGLPVAYSSQTPLVCTISVSAPVIVKGITAGTCTLTANQSGDASFGPAFAQQTFTVGLRSIDVRSYVPLSAAGSGYTSSVRVINTSKSATAVQVALIDGATGVVSPSGQLTAALPSGAAVTYNASQIEAALGLSLDASNRPRLRVSAVQAVPIEVQSFLRSPAGVFSEVSGAQTGSLINVRTYVPAAVSSYNSFVRIINTGAAASPVMVAMVDAASGAVSAAGVLNASLPAGGALTYSAAQIEAALGFKLGVSERPRLQISAPASTLEVQSYLSQPGSSFAEVSNAQTGSSVEVRGYAPAATVGSTSFVRIINASTAASPITVSWLDSVTGQVTATGNLIASLAGAGVATFTAAQVEAALGASIAVNSATQPRLRISSNGAALEVQSFLLQANGMFNEVSGAVTGKSPVVRIYIPQIDAAGGYSSSLRITNTGSTPAVVSAVFIDDATGLQLGNSNVVLSSLAAGATRTVTSTLLEAALGVGGGVFDKRIAPGSRPRVQISSDNVLDVQALISQPGGVVTEMSGGQ